jgi:hypothetical protein
VQSYDHALSDVCDVAATARKSMRAARSKFSMANLIAFCFAGLIFVFITFPSLCCIHTNIHKLEIATICRFVCLTAFGGAPGISVADLEFATVCKRLFIGALFVTKMIAWTHLFLATLFLASSCSSVL